MLAVKKVAMIVMAIVIALPVFARQDCDVELSGAQEVPPNESAAMGTADVFLAGRTLHFDITWSDLSSDFTGAHFHYAAAGESGPVVFSLEPFIDGSSARGVWVLSNEELEILAENEIYVNVHSMTYPGGEIRAQLDCDFEPRPGHGHGEGGDDCELELSGSQEVPPNESASTGMAELELEGNTLEFEIEWSGLTGDFTGAHFHHAVAGENGDVVFSLVPFVEGNSAEGEWELTEEELGWLMAGEIYVNVHSSTYPGGEIRAQVDCEFEDEDGDDEEACELDLGGDQEVPPNDSEYTGRAELELEGNTLEFEITWTGLTGDFTGAHFHHAVAGENGDVVFSLVPFVEGNSAEGEWELTEEELGWLLAGEIYVNVHSSTYPGGEIRAQVDCDFDGAEARVGPEKRLLTKITADEYVLLDNYPNPFNPETQIAFHLKEAGEVKLAVYDVLGREIVRLASEPMAAGQHRISFNGASLPSGIYFYRLDVNGFTDMKKMLLLK